MDAHNLCIGTVETPTFSGNCIYGKFIPTPHYEKYEKIFSSLEQAANDLLLIHADQIEKEIQKMGFYTVDPTNIKAPISDLQIMDGQIVFHIYNQEQAEAGSGKKP
ncbi:hypothetical protein NP537_05780 [Pseudomonas kurunegalensis]|nr:hypothetical protein [Pseudomonas kurunegalensis]